MERTVIALENSGYLTPKREIIDGKSFTRFIKQTPETSYASFVRQTPETRDSFHTPNTSIQLVTPSRGTGQIIFTENGYTPSPDTPEQFWTPSSMPDTPIRRAPLAPERTLLVERLPSTFILTPERQPLDFLSPDRSVGLGEVGKRGRPRADVITNLILEGSHSGNNIKCHICSRVFPREKSLQAHLRTHTGEKPYNCDYPGCTRAFTQSGQLKTHQRLHAGDKPFVCSAPEGCSNRYTHANRTCPDHPYAKPRRLTEIILQPVISANEDQSQVYAWLEKYKREREEKTPGKGGEEQELVVEEAEPTMLKSKRGLSDEMEQAYVGQENMPRVVELSKNKLTAQLSLNQALMRAEERLETNSYKVHNLGNQLNRSGNETPGFKSILEGHLSPAKVIRRSLEESSPMKSVRRTLGEITPSKNCKTDNVNNLDLELPFNFDLTPNFLSFSPQAIPLPLLPTTPIPREKSLTPSCLASPGVHGSPALKLKKRFQERFQEEKLQEKSEQELLAQPISWTEEDDMIKDQNYQFNHLLSTPVRGHRERPNSPTHLVATALLELHDSPIRNSNQELPLNLTKKSPQ